MKKESNGIGENKNSKKINKNNKIISSILAVAMCCQSLVGAVKPDSQPVDIKEMDSKETVEITEDKDENENKDESKKGDAIDKSKWLSILAKTIAGISVLGVGALVIYNAIKSKVVEPNAESPEVTEPKTGPGEVEIGGLNYFTHNIGEETENGEGFENLVVSIASHGGIFDFSSKISPKISPGESEFFLKVKIKSSREKEIEKLSNYSKFIVAIIKGGDYFLNYLEINGVKLTIEGIVTHACDLLKKQKNSPEFRLVNACVGVLIEGEDGGMIFFLISQELAPCLSEIVRESDVADDEI
ncbi:MAG: hypothetical protein CfP315_0407 [Candidatus Improbicoccus pseudotrichonymphae]|uniref:Uncharacterized protein n=1 Tax=Candidatus Improbicoccus pseudotrichonymphae TaxID=3033792 RepID=A0AA48I868_9FIRM|nr:MAG: hypothetical protein CfP315_0407 [Candidatus Improbicoccus pseudotrichonymphae]